MSRAAKDKSSAAGKLVKAILNLGQTHGINNVFTTFLEMMATSLSMTLDPSLPENREKRYNEIVSAMSPELRSKYEELCGLICLAAQENAHDPCDILGDVYHELRLNNEWNGQFFTPDNVCRMMAMMVNPVDETTVEKEGCITINEPTCGSGTMIIGAVWAMMKSNFPYKQKSLFVAQDIDIRCVWMTYIQLCLYDIPAVVIHGDTLTMKEWSRWYTPFVIFPLAEKERAEQRKENSDERKVA